MILKGRAMNMKKTLCCILALSIMAFSAAPCFAADAVNSSDSEQNISFADEVWVGGVKITNDNKNDVFSDGGSVKYDEVTDTLTLTDATIVNENGHGIYAYGINLQVIGIDTEAEGNNSIAGKSTVEKGLDEEGYEFTQTNPGCGILVEGDGYEGNGGLTISGSFGKISGEEGHGISAYRNISLSADIGKISCTGGIENGINSYFGCVIITEDANIDTIISKEHIGISAEKDIIISGKVDDIFGNGYSGVYTTSGDIFITGNVGRIIGFSSGIEAYSGTDWDEDGNEFSIGGSVKIGGTVNTISGGIVGVSADANLNISGSGEISASNPEEGRCAVSAGKELILPEDKDFIIEPKEYKVDTIVVDSYENEDGKVEIVHNTICDAEGNPALSLKFSSYKNSFADVKESDWYYDDVSYAVRRRLFNGITDTTFEPQSNLTRAMLVTVLWRMEKEPVVNYLMPFNDIASEQYYTEAVRWASSEKIVKGYSEKEFAPNDNITREQIAAIMYRYAQYKGIDVTQGGMLVREFEDYENISEYALGSMAWAVNTKLIGGRENNFLAPKDNATRAEMAAILHRFNFN